MNKDQNKTRSAVPWVVVTSDTIDDELRVA